MLRVLYSHSRLHSLFLVVVFYYFILQENLRRLVLLLLGKKSINISDCFVCVAYNYLSFNNGFNILFNNIVNCFYL